MSNDSSLQQKNEQLRTLNRLVEISLVLNSSLSSAEILEELMDASAEILDAESASVFLLDKYTHELHIVAITSDATYSDTLKRIPVPIDNSIAGAIVRENKSVVLDDVTEHPLHFRTADEQSGFRTRSLLGVPMKIKDRVVGALEAVNKREGRWTPEDEHYLKILASQAAVALEKAELVQNLQTANDELSKLDKMKNDFIAIASHELRTPLGVILGYASFLKEEARGNLSEHADTVMRSALRMRNLIEDMTNMRLVGTGALELQRERCSINELMRYASQDVLSMAQAKGHRVMVDNLTDDVLIQADRAKLITTLTNLLNNAVKFTPDGGHIQLTANERNGEVWVQVKDSGVGIPQESLESIFKSFTQVEDHMTRRHGGMGLGLTIAKAIVEAHGGRIWAESAGKDQGSIFTVSLPKATTPA